MAVSIVPALIDALVTQATAALPDVEVIDGVGVSEDSGDYLMIGVDDTDGPEWARSAATSREWEGTGLQAPVTESGDIACVALSYNGGTDQKLVRDAAYAIGEAVAAFCRADPTLGGLDSLLWVLYGANSDLLQIQNEDGVLARLEFQLHFEAYLL